jgi:radical SAM protein with 4Fe4S-binding SPASM domain
MKKFKKIYIEITNKCNLNCSFCSKDTREKREMTVDEFKNVLDKVSGYTESIYLHVKGEPLLHSKLEDILNICDDYNVKVCITTNGTLLKNKKSVLLKHNIKQINVSLHSENNYPDYFDNVFNTCDGLSKKITIIYRLWVLKDINKLSTIIVDKIIGHYKLSTEIVNKIYKDKNINIADNIYLDKDIEFTWPNDSNIELENTGTCYGTRSHIAILSNGTITPCCLDSEGTINLGNIFNDEMETVLNNKLFKEIKEGFQNNRIIHPLCRKCNYRLRFSKVENKRD